MAADCVYGTGVEVSDGAVQAHNAACVNCRVIVGKRQTGALGDQEHRRACLFGHYDLMTVVCLCFSRCPAERIPAGFDMAAALFNVPDMCYRRTGPWHLWLSRIR